MSKHSVFLTPDRMEHVRRDLTAGHPLRVASFRALEQTIGGTVPGTVPEEWFVPWYYVEPEAHHLAKTGLMNSSNLAYARALRHLLHPSNGDVRAVVAILEAWSGLRKTRTEQDSRLCYSYHFPALIFAASMLSQSGDLPHETDARFSEYLCRHALPMATVEHANNWGNWGLVLQSAIASYLDDGLLLEQSAERWKELLDTQIAPDGHLLHEVGRNDGNGDHGIWYSHFSLMPQAIAGEILENAGFPVFSQAGGRLALAYSLVVRWVLEPATFPYYNKACGKPLTGVDYIAYFEILQPRFPGEAGSAVLAGKRPVESRHSVLALTLTGDF